MDDKINYTKTYNNAVNSHEDFSDPKFRFTVSSRGLPANWTVDEYLNVYFPFIRPPQIETFFGNFSFFSKLYGGWGFLKKRSITECHIKEIRAMNCGISITLTNHYFDSYSYKESLPIIEILDPKMDSIICTNDDLAKQIRKDFPSIILKASFVKQLSNIEDVKQALELYDFVVIPMDKNTDDTFLNSLPEKHRLIVFANALCAFSCPLRVCYQSKSNIIRGKNIKAACSKTAIPRNGPSYIIFDIDKIYSFGFKHFKLIPPNTKNINLNARNLREIKRFSNEHN